MTSAITVVALAIVAVVVMWIIRLAKEYQERQKRTFRQFGFQALRTVTPELEEKLSITGAARKGPAKLRNVYLHAGGDYDLYRYNVIKNQRDNSIQYAMVLRNRTLPPFALMPNLKLPGFLNNMVAKLLEHVVAGTGMSEVTPRGCPGFREKYRLYAADPRQIERSVSASTWESLAALPATMMLQAHGDVITFQEFPYGKARKRAKLADQLRAITDHADQIHACLRETQAVRA